MNQRLEKELARILRRVDKLRALRSGDATVEYVEVSQCTVPEHQRGAHKRAIIRLKREPKPKLRIIRGGKS